MNYWTGSAKVLTNKCSAGAAAYSISPEQVKFYNDNGFLVIKSLIDFETLYRYKQQFVNICNGLVDKGQITIVKEPSLLGKGYKPVDYINKLHDISYDDVFGTYLEDPRLLQVLTQFIGDEITAVNSMLINKPPGTERHPPHQDLFYFPFRPAEKIMAAWTAIDDVTIENGALFLVPGSHKANTLYPHGNVGISKKLYHGILNEESLAPSHRVVHLEMSPGDTVFFHPLIIHGSGPNVTKFHRKSMTCHFMNRYCEYIDVRGTLQDEIVMEIEQESKRRGFDISFEEQWRYRSKEVKGSKTSTFSKLNALLRRVHNFKLQFSKSSGSKLIKPQKMHAIQCFKLFKKNIPITIVSRKYKHHNISFLQEIYSPLKRHLEHYLFAHFNQTLKTHCRSSTAAAASNHNILPEQFNFYNENGYLVIKNLIDFESLNSYKNQFINICNKLVDRGQISIVKEPSLLDKGYRPEDYINKLNDICFDDVFAKYTEGPQLLHVLSQFVGDEITAVNSMFINKPPGSERHPPHQDLYYFPFRPVDKIIAVWTAIDHVTIENGALFVVPGSHKANTIYPHGNVGIAKRLYHGILKEEELAPLHKLVHLEMSPGDTMFFHPLVIHGSGPNVSKSCRKSLTCHFMDTNCEYINVRGTVQDVLVKEVEEEMKRIGFDISFEDQWRNKSKQVKGVKSKI
ncbi:uncharacterized protein ACR2FA_007970 [Aphomia sociella]